MIDKPSTKDLVILAADISIESTLKGLLTRHQSLGIRPISSDCFVHPQRDPGCFSFSHAFLRPFTNLYHHALVVFDHDGCGRESLQSDAIEEEVTERLSQNGWAGQASVIVLTPELEAWVWSNSPHVSEALGWKGNAEGLQNWLIAEGFSVKGQTKPYHPKDALHHSLKFMGIPRSSSLFHQLALKVSFERCVDPAFLKFKALMKQWFSVSKPIS